MSRVYTFAGFSTSPAGTRKLRCSNDPEGRAGTLKGHQDRDITWIPLPREMTRREALEWLVQHEMNQGVSKVTNEFRGKKPTEQVETPEPDPQVDWLNEQ